MDKIKYKFLLNLKRRDDKLNFMKFKLNDININNYEIVYGIDGLTDPECEILYQNYLNSLTDNDLIKNLNTPYIHKKTVFAIIKSFKLIFEKVLNYDDNDYILILEDDIIFNKKFSKYKFDLNYDVIYLGANQINLKKEMKKNYSLLNDINYATYGMFSIIYKVGFIKSFYNDVLKDVSKLRMPIDYLLWNYIIRNNVSNIVICPNLIIPNLLNSDNMPTRDQKKFSLLKGWNLSDYKFINLELQYYDLVKKHPRRKKGQIDNLDFKTIYKVIDGNFYQ